MALANYLLSHALDDEIGSILSEYSVNFVPVVDNGPEAALAKAGDCSPANAARKVHPGASTQHRWATIMFSDLDPPT